MQMRCNGAAIVHGLFLLTPQVLQSRMACPLIWRFRVFFAELQRRGIPMAIWRNGAGTGTTYLACRYDGRLRVEQVIDDLECQGILEKQFLASHCAMLFERGNPGV